MLFQALDSKRKCAGIYLGGELHFEDISINHLTKTWTHAPFLDDNENIQYAKLYCGGLSLREACPSHLTARWERVETKLAAFIKSFSTARVSLDENCFFDLVPQRYLLEMCYLKNKICEHVFNTYEKPSDYEYKLELTKCLNRIKHQKLQINSKNLSLYRKKHRKFAQDLRNINPYCKFNINGPKTGRLTPLSSGFPILTLNKEFRSVIEPKNDYFIELDYNAAELRTLLSLQGKPQPEGDIHEWNIQNIFRGLGTRDEAKKRIFAWLYNPESEDYLCERAYDRDSVVQKYFTRGQVTTFWDKVIPSEERTALNYIIQSTSAENVLRQMIKLSNYLKDRKSFISFPVHDSVVIDFSIEDREMLPNIIEMFADTELGKFTTNISVGRNFGDLKKIEVKS